MESQQLWLPVLGLQEPGTVTIQSIWRKQPRSFAPPGKILAIDTHLGIESHCLQECRVYQASVASSIASGMGHLQIVENVS